MSLTSSLSLTCPNLLEIKASKFMCQTCHDDWCEETRFSFSLLSLNVLFLKHSHLMCSNSLELMCCFHFLLPRNQKQTCFASLKKETTQDHQLTYKHWSVPTSGWLQLCKQGTMTMTYRSSSICYLLLFSQSTITCKIIMTHSSTVHTKGDHF